MFLGSDSETHCLSVGNLTLQVIFREGTKNEVYYYYGQIPSEHLIEYMKNYDIRYEDFYCLYKRRITMNIKEIVERLKKY